MKKKKKSKLLLIIILILIIICIISAVLIKKYKKNTNNENQEKVNVKEIYNEYIAIKGYNTYIQEWNSEPKQYSILDINQDGIEELLIITENNGLRNMLILSYIPEDEAIVLIDEEALYGEPRYSQKDKEIVYAIIEPTQEEEQYIYAYITDYKLQEDKSLIYHAGEGYHIESNSEAKTLTADEHNEYFKDLTNIEFVDIQNEIIDEVEQ